MATPHTKLSDNLDSYLSPNQQDLLLAALNSQATAAASARPSSPSETQRIPRSTHESTMSASNAFSHLGSPPDDVLDGFTADYSPVLDYFDGENGFDFENADLGGDMIGALPGSSADGGEHHSGHEKRKSRDETGDENDPKRQETQEGEKGAKKPGRKPLTSEPTTKRKAQNRAAQRAFRDRKEKHLKDLETKVSELTKAKEADKHENGLLKAQVERLNVELREYRKRLSLNNSSTGRSPPLTAKSGQQRSSSGPSFNGTFQFDFPKFGALPGSQIFGNQGLTNSPSPITNHRDSMTPPSLQSSGVHGQQPSSLTRQSSAISSLSPESTQMTGSSNRNGTPQIADLDSSFTPYSTNNNMHGFASTLPQMNDGGDPFGDLFSPSILKTASMDNFFTAADTASIAPKTDDQTYSADNGGHSTAGLNRVFQFNSGSSSSDSASPSASSSSQWNANANSSCGTSPEPSHDSPPNKDKFPNSSNDGLNRSRHHSDSVQSSGFTKVDATRDANLLFGSTDFNIPTIDSFDPVLFGDYRDSQAAIMGCGEFNNGFFDDAVQPFDFGSPSNMFGILQSPQQSNATLGGTSNAAAPSRNLMAEVDKAREGGDDDYGLPGTQTATGKKLISCNNIWNQLQTNKDFQEGKFDLDGLCSELRVKARCSESGVMVDQDHVNAALKKLGNNKDTKA